MPSFQSAAPGAKSSKFKALDPFAPFTAQPGDEPEDIVEEITQQTDTRTNQGPQRQWNNAVMQNDPTQQQQAPQHMQNQEQEQSEMQHHNPQVDLKDRSKTKSEKQADENDEEEDDNDDDSFNDSDFEDDPAMEAFRQRRLKELKRTQIKHCENIAKGHGECRTISQDEFLPECTGSSEFVAVHFFHEEFERCKIMDMHLKKVCKKHTTCRFLRINAEKAPFFVTKLQIQTLPTLVIFQDGKTIERLTGFEGMSSSVETPDKFRTKKLEQWLHTTGAISYKEADDSSDDESEDEGRPARGGGFFRRVHKYDEDF